MRRRLRDLGFAIGALPTGPQNAITDVAGVRVGHTTLIQGDGALEVGRGPVRTGVTAIVPPDPVFSRRLPAGAFVLNGAGEVSGLTQVLEWGLIETPILLTSTLSVGRVSDAVVEWMARQFPDIGQRDGDAVIPLVGECDDSWLGDSAGRHVRAEHVHEAIERAASGPVAEGSVGAGTGMVTCDFKAGIGTSSRRVAIDGATYTVGVLVQSNFGVMRALRIRGAPVGEILDREFITADLRASLRARDAGSIICVLATDAPLLAAQLSRLGKRVALGVARAGSSAANASGEIMIAFSTANPVPRAAGRALHRFDVLIDDACDGLFEAAADCTEEAIANALCMADEMRGHSGHHAPALPLDRLADILGRFVAAAAPPGDR